MTGFLDNWSKRDKKIAASLVARDFPLAVLATSLVSNLAGLSGVYSVCSSIMMYGGWGMLMGVAATEFMILQSESYKKTFLTDYKKVRLAAFVLSSLILGATALTLAIEAEVSTACIIANTIGIVIGVAMEDYALDQVSINF